MKTIMQKYHEVHGNDGVILYCCFLRHFAGTNAENIVEAYSQLSESNCLSTTVTSPNLPTPSEPLFAA